MNQVFRPPHTAIIGSGIIGATLAYTLARRGVPVTVVDEGVAANRATGGSFAWINAHDPDDADYFALRLDSMRLWRDMAAQITDLPVRFGGALNWERPDRIETVARALNEGGNPARLVSRARIREMEPALANPPEVAIDAPSEGVADPDHIVQVLLAAAVALGAVMRAPVRVAGIATTNGRVTGLKTGDGTITADNVVVAAGRATPALLAGLGVALPMAAPPGLLVRTQAVPRLSQRILANDDLHVWQMDNGKLILGEDFGGSEVGEDRAAMEARVLARAQATFTTVQLNMDSSMVTARPTPGDGYPVMGRISGIDGLLVATMHSGMTLAPVMARALTTIILDNTGPKPLERYGIARFT